MTDVAVAAPPDYVGVGCLGTRNRWWHQLLLDHPQIRDRSVPEMALSFFQQFCGREMTHDDVAAYHRNFARPEGVLDGEWTQRYVFDPWTPPLLARAAPAARILVMLADPVERYRRKLAIPRDGVEDRHVGYWVADVTTRGRYATQLRQLFEHVDRERTLVLQYERCRRDPAGEYARTLRFLGVDDSFRPPRGWEPGALDPPASRVGRARRALGRARRRLVGGAPPPPPPEPPLPELWADLRSALAVEIGPEVEALAKLMPDLDLDLWPHTRAVLA